VLKGVILAGGTGTRLYPLTHLVNKHLLPVGRKPMLEHAIEKCREAGILDLIVVIGKQSAQLYAEYFGNGAKWGVRLAFLIQERPGRHCGGPVPRRTAHSPPRKVCGAARRQPV